MNAKVKPVEDGMLTVTPHLVCANAGEAMDFYKRAFGATELRRMKDPAGKLMHGMIQIGDARVMLVDEMPQWGALGPLALKGSPVTIHLSVPNADEVFDRAVAAGANPMMPMADQFWGDRYGIVIDPYGHKWSIATHIRDVSDEETKAAIANMAAMSKDCPGQ